MIKYTFSFIAVVAFYFIAPIIASVLAAISIVACIIQALQTKRCSTHQKAIIILCCCILSQPYYLAFRFVKLRKPVETAKLGEFCEMNGFCIPPFLDDMNLSLASEKLNTLHDLHSFLNEQYGLRIVGSFIDPDFYSGFLAKFKLGAPYFCYYSLNIDISRAENNNYFIKSNCLFGESSLLVTQSQTVQNGNKTYSLNELRTIKILHYKYASLLLLELKKGYIPLWFPLTQNEKEDELLENLKRKLQALGAKQARKI